MKASEFRKLIREEVRKTISEQPSDPRFTYRPADPEMLDAVKRALSNINQQALSRDTANLVLQNEIKINKDGNIEIVFYSKPRK